MIVYLLALIIVVFAVVAEYSGLDLYLARFFFDPATPTWPLKSILLPRAAQRQARPGPIYRDWRTCWFRSFLLIKRCALTGKAPATSL